MSTNLQDVTLETIDFNWIKQTSKLSHLKRAIALIEKDGNYYTELKDACYTRMEEIDPSCKRIIPNSYISEQIKSEVNSELQQWESSVGGRKVVQPTPKPENNLQDIQKYFDNEESSLDQNRKKERAEKERTKGNEAIKSKDFQQAISYYTKSIDLDPGMYQSYGNRALAYLKKKQHQRCIADCEKALILESTYAKAWHRKAKALTQLKRRVEAYKCFKEILRLQPQNNDVNKEMMELREEMSQAEIRELESHLIPQSEFKKITIEQDSDDQIEQK